MRNIVAEQDKELKIWKEWLEQGLITNEHYYRIMKLMNEQLIKEIGRAEIQIEIMNVFVKGLNAAETVMACRSIGQGGSYVL